MVTSSQSGSPIVGTNRPLRPNVVPLVVHRVHAKARRVPTEMASPNKGWPIPVRGYLNICLGSPEIATAILARKPHSPSDTGHENSW
ncbi:hypothetical protein EV130_11080 [Rhizobium azibense]|uniref:Uncharacterized protein n=1 Tax=Rhizobium azibense TaxID=1136135 RepID=A0A4R3QT82_9HYPH|nr:hypothetical protein EV130_11080 [Rhizobium azibense]